jgi:hypothetical protein
MRMLKKYFDSLRVNCSQMKAKNSKKRIYESIKELQLKKYTLRQFILITKKLQRCNLALQVTQTKLKLHTQRRFFASMCSQAL